MAKADLTGAAGGSGGALATAGGGGGSTTTIPVVTSHPERLLRHSISDEELEMLGDSKRSALTEFMWAMVALATGALPSAAVALWDSYVKADPEPLSVLGLINVLLLVAGAVLAGLSGFVVKSKGKAAEDLIQQIRARRAS